MLDVRVNCQNSLTSALPCPGPRTELLRHTWRAKSRAVFLFNSLTAACRTSKHLWPSLTIFDVFTSAQDLWIYDDSEIHFLQCFSKFQWSTAWSLTRTNLPFFIFYLHFSAPSGHHRQIKCTPHGRRHVDAKGWEVDNFTGGLGYGRPRGQSHLTSSSEGRPHIRRFGWASQKSNPSHAMPCALFALGLGASHRNKRNEMMCRFKKDMCPSPNFSNLHVG